MCIRDRRLFTHVLGHAGYSHYMGNMLLLLLVGPPLEEKYGSRTLLLTIAVTALVTGLAQFIFFPQTALLGAKMCIRDRSHRVRAAAAARKR